MNVSMDKPTYAEKFLIISMSFYYAVGVIWTGSIWTKEQQVTLWTLAVLWVLLALSFVAKGKLSFSTKPTLYIVSLSSFLFFAWSSYGWATNADRVASRGALITRIILSMMVFSLLLTFSGSFRAILKSIEYGGYMSVCYLILRNGVSYMTEKMLHGSRLTYTGVNSNTIGLVAAFAIIVAFYFFTVEGFKISTLFVIPCGFIIVLSVSKKSFLALIIGVVLFRMLCTTKKNRFVNNIIKIIGILCIVAIALYFLSSLPFMASVIKRMQAFFVTVFGNDGTTAVDTSTRERMELKQCGYELIQKNPLLGVGLDNARYFNKYTLYLHDNFLEIFADLGIFGFCAYYSIYAVNAVRFLKNWNTEDKEFNICVTLLILLLILDYSRVSYYNLSTYYMLLLLCIKSGALVKAKLEAEKNSRELALREMLFNECDE